MEKPAVNAGDGVDFLHGDPGLQGLEDGEKPPVVLLMEPLSHRCGTEGRGVQGVQADLRPADSLHQSHLKAGGNGHHLAGGLHLGAQLPAGAGKLIKGPLGQLYHHVVQGGLKAGAGLAGDLILDLRQGVAQGDAGADLGDGVAGGLGGQGRGAGHPGVHLNDGVLKGIRVQGKLAVAAAHDPQLRNDVQGGGAEHLILLVRQGQGRGHHDGVPGVDAHRVKVFHGTDGNHVAGAVPQGLKLDLFPAGDAALHQNLVDGGLIQAALGDLPQGGLVPGDAAAGAAQGEGGADDHWVADACRDFQGLCQGFRRVGGDHRLAHGLQGVPEKLPVLGPVNGFNGRTQKPHTVAIQGAVPGQLHGDGQAGLAPKPCQQAVGPLLLNNTADGLGGERLQVDLVGQVLVGHDGGGIGVDQHGLNTLLPQHPAGLGPGVVKLRRLADDDGAGADDQHLVYAFILRHGSSLPSWR